jgi:hypothetical protein
MTKLMELVIIPSHNYLKNIMKICHGRIAFDYDTTLIKGLTWSKVTLKLIDYWIFGIILHKMLFFIAFKNVDHRRDRTARTRTMPLA